MKKIQELFSVSGKNAVVTGGTKGLGRAITCSLLENGCNVAVLCRRPAADPELEKAAEEGGAKLIIEACDVCVSADCVKAVERVCNAFGGIDILINCAGIMHLAFVGEMSDEAWDQTILANLTGTFHMIREVSGVMKKQGGCIINMSSMKSYMGTSKMGYAAYCASKGGINMLTKQCAAEMGQYNIRVNAIAPTFIETDMNRSVLEKDGYREKLASRIPIGRIGQTDDLLGLVYLLSSDASAFINGQIFYLDGGLSAAQE